MSLVLVFFNVLLVQSGTPAQTPSDKSSDQVILQIVKTGGVGGVHQECLVFRNGRMVLPGGTTVQLEPKETERLVTLAKRLPPKPKHRGTRGAASHDYPLWYSVRIFEAGKETEWRFPVETKDATVKEFVAAVVSHERRAKAQLKTP